MNEEDISRDVGHYSLTIHARQQMKYRNIDELMIAETIENGEIRNSHKEDSCLFIHEFWFADEPVAVIANYLDGDIQTVEWRHE